MLQFILSLNCKALKKSQASQVNLQGDSVFQLHWESNQSVFAGL